MAELATSDRYGIAQRTVLCRRCGLIQSNPRMSEASLRLFYGSDEYRRLYDGDDFVSAVERNFEDGRGEIVLAGVAGVRPLAEIDAVLEFGAGGGWNLLPFVRAGVSAVGYDYSPQLVELGRSKGIDLRVGGLEDVEGSYDVIVLNHVVEHFTDVPAGLRTLASHLRPGGFLWVEVPDMDNFHLGQLQSAHTYYFTMQTLAHAASLAGLAATRQRHEPNSHMSAVLVPDPAASVSVGRHAEETAERLLEFQRSYRRRTPLRAVARALDAVGIGRSLRRALRPR